MKVAIRLSEHLGEAAYQRGIVKRIHEATGIERHTIRAMLRNSARYVSLETLGRLSKFLIDEDFLDPHLLPGALIGQVREHFWELLANCQDLHFCLGTRLSSEWPDVNYVMSSDARLQGVLLSTLERFGRLPSPSPTDAGTSPPVSSPTKADTAPPGPSPTQSGTSSPGPPPTKAATSPPGKAQHFPEFHLIHAPQREATPERPGSRWPVIRHRAEELDAEHSSAPNCALIALGSTKVNPVVELMLARTFLAKPFVSREVSRANSRRCPLWFQFRPKGDPKPPSFCGGTRLSAEMPELKPGIYFETQNGQWEGCVCDDLHDAGYLFYAYHPHTSTVEVACGGFSSRATNCLGHNLETIIAQFEKPQWEAGNLRLGLFVIEFNLKPDAGDGDRKDSLTSPPRVIPVPEKALARRLGRPGRARRA